MQQIQVVKRDGTKEPFDANKINMALLKAAEGLPLATNNIGRAAPYEVE